MPYLLRELQSVGPVESACGPLMVLSSVADSQDGSLALLQALSEGAPHVHHFTTEFYYVLSGLGAIRIDGQDIQVQAGSFVLIYPETRHQVRPAAGESLELLVFSTPAWREDDEIIVDPDDDESESSEPDIDELGAGD